MEIKMKVKTLLFDPVSNMPIIILLVVVSNLAVIATITD